jgi:hypothetical protein
MLSRRKWLRFWRLRALPAFKLYKKLRRSWQ